MADPPMPDLSHLSAEERAIIEQVFQRQKEEEEKEVQISQKANQELVEIERQIQERKETAHRLLGTQDDAICQICQKTKFADGIGHKCFYCQLRSCARCGGRTQSKNKPIWACSLCQKRQSILAKTGKWFQPDDVTDVERKPSDINIGLGGNTSLVKNTNTTTTSNINQGKGNGNTVKDNTNVEMDNNQGNVNVISKENNEQNIDSTNTRNQLPHQKISIQRQPTVEIMGNNLRPSTSMNQGMPQQQIHPEQMIGNQLQHQQLNTGGHIPRQHPPQNKMQMTSSSSQIMGPQQKYHPQQSNNPPSQQQQSQASIQQQPQQTSQSTATSLFGKIIGGVASGVTSAISSTAHSTILPTTTITNNTTTIKGTTSQISSSPSQNYPSTTGIQSMGGGQQSQYQQPPGINTIYQDKINYDNKNLNQQYKYNISNNGRGNDTYEYHDNNTIQYNNDTNLLYQNQETNNFIESQQPPVIQTSDYHNQILQQNLTRKGSKKSRNLQRQYQSLSSSDEEQFDIRTTTNDNTIGSSLPGRSPSYRNKHSKSNFLSKTPNNILSTDISTENDILRYIYGSDTETAPINTKRRKSYKIFGQGMNSLSFDDDSLYNDGNSFKSNNIFRRRRSNSIRSDKGSFPLSSNFLQSLSSPLGYDNKNDLADKIKRYLNSPVTWTPTADKKRLIGHMVLNKNDIINNNTSPYLTTKPFYGDLGLKVIGGHKTPIGRLGAFITKIKPGSVADVIGHLRPGDEVLEWNGICLQNMIHEQVYDIINQSKNDQSIELIVSRDLINNPFNYINNFGNNSISQLDINNFGGNNFSGEIKRPMSARGFLYNNTGKYSPEPYGGSSNFITSQGRNNMYIQDGGNLRHSQSLLSSSNYHFNKTGTLGSGGQYQNSFSPSGSVNGILPQQFIQTNPQDIQMYSSNNPMLLSPYHQHHPQQQSPTNVGVNEITGRIEISLLYSSLDKQLIVTIHRALDLTPRVTGGSRNPYVKLFLLPDRSEKSRRQTVVLSDSMIPVWNETFYYQNITEDMLFGDQKRVLEVTLWDYDKYDANMFLGEVLIDFNTVPLNNEICLYNLLDMDDEHPIRMYLRHRKGSYTNPLSTSSKIQPPRPHSEMAYYPSSGLPPPGNSGSIYHNYHYNQPNNINSIFYDYPTGTLDMNKRSRNPISINNRNSNISRSRTYDRSAYNNIIDKNKRNYYPNNIDDLMIRDQGGGDYPIPDYDYTPPPGDKINNGYLSDTGGQMYRNSSGRSIPLYDNTGNERTYSPKNQNYYDNRYGKRQGGYRNLPNPDDVPSLQQQQQQSLTSIHNSNNDQQQTYFNESGTSSYPPYQQHDGRDQQKQYYGNQCNDIGYNNRNKNDFIYDTRTPQGRLRYEATMMQEGGGYGSDNSESLSINSIQSLQNNTTTTVIRRSNQGIEEYDGGSGITVIRHEPIEEADYGMMGKDEGNIRRRDNTTNNKNQSTGNGVLPSGGSGQISSGTTSGQGKIDQNLKDRKKSIMTRLIPGRSQPSDCPKRTGFARSEEVGVPDNLTVNGSGDRLQAPFLKQASKDSTDSSHSENIMPLLPDGPLGHFIENLGPGQVVGRQVLASPVLGEINIAISLVVNRSGTGHAIDIEIIRAKNLVTKPGSKTPPSPYVKVYLLEGKNCIAKAKTSLSNRKTVNPLFQQHLIFNENYKKKMIQVSVLGDYGRMERKSFMGIALIRLDDLNLENNFRATGQPVVGWYKLFHNNSLAGTGPIRKDSENSLMG
ncbi:Rim [Strongyloides ratti]|uniref:Rim n=1 Tax=Strongyloides ratti TaxID=34506 RepID=A0A090L2C9_STRRB|nr:Rim [Strongyloides ratti]CEF62232.1 Rim [Strongyloides ratti]